MYNAKPIEDFIRKVEKEAEAAAQKVFDAYEQELIQKIKNQMQVGDDLIVGNGTATFRDDKDRGNRFLTVVAMTQYQCRNWGAGFCLPDIKK